MNIQKNTDKTFKIRVKYKCIEKVFVGKEK